MEDFSNKNEKSNIFPEITYHKDYVVWIYSLKQYTLIKASDMLRSSYVMFVQDDYNF